MGRSARPAWPAFELIGELVGEVDLKDGMPPLLYRTVEPGNVMTSRLPSVPIKYATATRMSIMAVAKPTVIGIGTG